jgi:hypothetical protein
MQLNVRDIIELQSQRDNPMVSIFVPLMPSEPRQAQIILRNLIRETERRLDLEFASAETSSLMAGLREQAGSVDLATSNGSVALFASSEEARVVRLPYPVRAEVVVDETFATRNLLHALQRSSRYLVVILDDVQLRCFEMAGSSIREIPDGSLALPEGSHPEKSWQGEFSERVDEILEARLLEDPLPMILLAPDALQRAFLKRSTVRRHVVAAGSGRFEGADVKRIADVVSRLVREHELEDRRATLARLAEARDRNRLATGIHDVWDAARQGRVALVVVEQSYQFPATLGDDGGLIEQADAAFPGAMDDAVDEVLEVALRHDAELRFAPDTDLSEWAGSLQFFGGDGHGSGPIRLPVPLLGS